MEYFKVRNEAGDEQEVEVGKILEAEKDGYLPIVRKENTEYRVSSQDFGKAAEDGYNPVKTSDMSTLEVGARGVGEGVTAGWLDELVGAGKSAAEDVGIALGLVDAPQAPAPKRDEFGRVTNPEELTGNYEKYRDEFRAKQKEAQIASPAAFKTGEVVGGIGSALIPGGAAFQAGKGASLATKAGLGALAGATSGGVYGAGTSEAETLPELAIDTAKGAATGAAFGAAIPVGAAGAKKAWDAATDMAAPMWRRIESFRRGMKTGAAEKGVLDDVPFVNLATKTLKGIKGGIKEASGTAKADKEFADMAREARITMLGKSGDLPPKDLIKVKVNLDDMTDEEAILMALMDEGENKVKNWVAEKAATELPGNIKKEDYLDILNMSPNQRMMYRSFDKKEAAKGLTEELSSAQSAFKQARGESFEQLQKEASDVYDIAQTGKVLTDMDEALGLAERIKGVPGSVKSIIEDAKEKITQGIGTKKQGLTEAALDEVDAAEHYLRLQRARQGIDKKLKWSQKEGISDAEEILRDVRDSIDKALKSAAGKEEADALYRASKQIEKDMFGAVEFGKGFDARIDEQKLARLLGGTDSAARFQNSLQDFKEFIQNPRLSEEFRQQGADLVRRLEDSVKKVQGKAKLEQFRWKEGPTSPAIERMQAITGKQSPVQSAVAGPSTFVNQMDEVVKSIQEGLGKPMQKLTQKERAGVAKVWAWRNKNQDASPQKLDEFIKNIFPGIKRKEAVDEFLNQ